MQGVRAGLENHVYNSAACRTVLGREAIINHVELGNGIRRWIHNRALRADRSVQGAIEKPYIGASLAPVGADARSHQVKRVRESAIRAVKTEVGTRGTARLDHAWH